MTCHSNAAASAAVTTNQGQLITSVGATISVAIMFTIRRQPWFDGDGAALSAAGRAVPGQNLIVVFVASVFVGGGKKCIIKSYGEAENCQSRKI